MNEVGYYDDKVDVSRLGAGSRVQWMRDGRFMSGYVKTIEIYNGATCFRVESNGHTYRLNSWELT